MNASVEEPLPNHLPPGGLANPHDDADDNIPATAITATSTPEKRRRSSGCSVQEQEEIVPQNNPQSRRSTAAANTSDAAALTTTVTNTTTTISINHGDIKDSTIINSTDRVAVGPVMSSSGLPGGGKKKLDHQHSGPAPFKTSSMAKFSHPVKFPENYDDVLNNQGDVDQMESAPVSLDDTTFQKVANMKSKIRPGKKKKVLDGEVVFKGHPSWSIVLVLQKGIGYTTEVLRKYPMEEITPERFKDHLLYKLDLAENKRDPKLTAFSGHTQLIDQAPYVYKMIRNASGIQDNDFRDSLTGQSKLRELPTPGKSGALFYISQDEQYFIKTINTYEEGILSAMLPAYFEHVTNNPNTYLTKFLASYSIRTRQNHHIRLVCMSSIFRSGLYIDKKYDLKGSTHGRKAHDKSKPNVTLKDLDFDVPIYLKKEIHRAMFVQLERDSLFLEEQGIIDYSLLVGLSEVTPEDELYYSDLYGPEEENAPWILGYEDVKGKKVKKYRIEMGIIDILQGFTVAKRAEYWMKSGMYCAPNTISVNPPTKYQSRFYHFMESKFKAMDT